MEEDICMKTLVVIDMQKDFIDGALGTDEAIAIIPNVKKKIQEYVDNKWNIVFTQDTHREDYLETNEGRHLQVPHCIVGSDGHKIPTELIPTEIPTGYECVVCLKHTFGYRSWLKNDLINFEDSDIEIIGLCTDICVITNALILKTCFPENNIIVDASCCAGTTPEKHKAALEVMKSCQIEVVG